MDTETKYRVSKTPSSYSHYCGQKPKQSRREAVWMISIRRILSTASTSAVSVESIGEYNSAVIQEAKDAEQLAVFGLKTFYEVKIGEMTDGKNTKAGEAEAVFDEAHGG